MRNKKISSSLISYNIKKRRRNKIKLIVAQILLLIGLSVAGTIAYAKVRTDIMWDRAEYIELERCIDGTLATFCEEGWDVRQAEDTGVEAIADEAPVASVEEQIRRMFPEDPNTAVAIAKCESGLNPDVIGDGHTAYVSVGLMQIRTLPTRMDYYNLTVNKLKDPVVNLLMARIIYDRSGWQPWSCYTKGYYNKYL